MEGAENQEKQGQDAGAAGDQGTSADQSQIMSEVLDLAATGKSAEKEPEGQPNMAETGPGAKDGKEESKAPDTGAQPPKEPKDKDGKAEGKAGAEKGADGKPKADAKATEPDPKEQLIDVPTDEGVRKVPLKNLVTTYTQHRHLQQQHERVKPMFDLARQTNLPVEKLYPYLVLGIQTAYAKKTGGAAPGATSTGGGASGNGQYAGPFKDAQEDERVKDLDPVLHDSTWNMFRRNQQLETMSKQILTRLDGMQSGSQRAGEEQIYKELRSSLEKKIGDFAGQHTEYFKPDAAGRSERMEMFKAFLGRNLGHVDISELTPEMLALAFQSFDPGYTKAWMEQDAKRRQAELLGQTNRTFGETNNARAGSPAGKLSEDQQIMREVIG